MVQTFFAAPRGAFDFLFAFFNFSIFPFGNQLYFIARIDGSRTVVPAKKCQKIKYPLITIPARLFIQGCLVEADVRFHEAIGLLECALGDDHPRLVPTLIKIAELVTQKVVFRVSYEINMIILKNMI